MPDSVLVRCEAGSACLRWLLLHVDQAVALRDDLVAATLGPLFLQVRQVSTCTTVLLRLLL